MKRIVLLLAFLLPIVCSAGFITFDLRDDMIEDIDGVNSFSFSVDGVTATLTALPAIYTDTGGVDRDLVLNRTTSGFGINVEGLLNTGGCSSEDSDGVDDGCVAESIMVSLSVEAMLVAVDVSSFGSSDEASVDFESGAASHTISSTGSTSIGEMIGGAGNTFQIAFVSGNGFSFDSFTIETLDVPEPASIALIMMGMAGLVLSRRKQIH